MESVLRFVACDRPVSGNNRLVLFEDFSDHSYSCLLPSTKSPLIIAISFAVLESFSVLFLQAKIGECFALWFALTPPPLKWLTEQKNPFEVCKLAARYNEFGYKSSYKKKILAKIFLPKKNPEIEDFKPKKILRSSRSPRNLEYLPPPELKLLKVLISISYCELKE